MKYAEQLRCLPEHEHAYTGISNSYSQQKSKQTLLLKTNLTRDYQLGSQLLLKIQNYFCVRILKILLSFLESLISSNV